MQISDSGIIVGKRLLEENSGIITIFSKNHGLYSGVVKKLSTKNGDIYQIGNLVDFTWNARLPTHIGTMRCELIRAYAARVIYDKQKLYLLSSILSVIAASLKVGEEYTSLFYLLQNYIEELSGKNISFLKYISMELSILSEVGYSIDLSRCSVTGGTEDLAYVSPKSGKSVTSSIGIGLASKLLKLPNFIVSSSEPTSAKDVQEAMHLTGYFFKRYVFHNLEEPMARICSLKLLMRSFIANESIDSIIASKVTRSILSL
ncbi:MAG UNVERIFIED_CONTAM: DNA repair protein RecO [Rickettsiaceae bacterium]|jgi:DNA repair protein RecO (recombination protein O)